MNRRTFLASLPFLPSAAKAAVQPAPELYKCVIEYNTKTYRLLSVPWLQTSRVSRCVSDEYLDAVDLSMNPRGSPPWIDAHRRRARRKLNRQLAMPAPNLP
jgi:hypothetical protein